MSAMRTIDRVHCQQCGSTDEENVGYDALRIGEGYTACCNERAIYPQPIDAGMNFYSGKRITRPYRCDPDDCYHA
jgi:hypothetical protein